MSTAEDPSDRVRQEMITAIEDRKYDFTQRAWHEGLDAFRTHSENPSHEELIDYILELLKSGFPLRRVELHDRPGEEAHELKNADGRGLYIKLKYDWPSVIVMSFHY